MLQAVSKNGLTIKESKCVWAAESLEYLGHVVGKGKLSVPEARVRNLLGQKQ